MTLADLSVSAVLLAALAIGVGMFVQSAAGFGAGLAALPILLWAGWPLPEAICVVVAAATAQLASGVWRYRREIPWPTVWHVTAYRVLAMAPGLFLLIWLDTHADLAKQAIGGAVVVAALLRAAIRVRPRKHLHPAVTAATGLTSGFLATGVGIGGPPLVIWASAHRWSNRATRGVLWAAFLIGIPPYAGLLIWKFGARVIPGTIVGVGLIPVSLGGMALGMVAVRKLSPTRLRALMLGVLVVFGLATLVQPWLA
ncbi:MAG: TSUP family transporter [Planctomycetota bacterium]